jgi:hypothetical protein
MPKLLVDKEGREWICERDETRNDGTHFNFIQLPVGSIEKLTGRKLKVKDEPLELVLSTETR